MGRHRADSAVLSGHLGKDRQWDLRQPRSEYPPHVVLQRAIITLHAAQTSLLRALSPTTPTYVFPAMNTLMYEHPLTEQHLRVIREVIGYTIVGPIGKTLACGDVGTHSLLVRSAH